MIWLLAGVLGLPAFLAFMALANRRRWQEWDSALSPDGAAACQRLQVQLAQDQEMIDDAYTRARALRETGQEDHALRLVDYACALMTEASEDRTEQLRDMRVYVRMLTAAVEPPPLRQQFQLLELRGLAAVFGLLRLLVMTSAERIILRLYAIQFGFWSLVRSVQRATGRARRPKASKAWATLLAGQHDFAALDQETLATFEAVVQSIILRARQEQAEARRRLA